MRKILLMFCILTLLAGCEDFEKDVYSILKTAEIIHTTVHEAALDAKKRDLITIEEANQIADALDLYQGTFLTIKVIFEAYLNADEEDKKLDLKKNIRQGLSFLVEDQKRLRRAYMLILDATGDADVWTEKTSK